MSKLQQNGDRRNGFHSTILIFRTSLKNSDPFSLSNLTQKGIPFISRNLYISYPKTYTFLIPLPVRRHIAVRETACCSSRDYCSTIAQRPLHNCGRGFAKKIYEQRGNFHHLGIIRLILIPLIPWRLCPNSPPTFHCLYFPSVEG